MKNLNNIKSSNSDRVNEILLKSLRIFGAIFFVLTTIALSSCGSGFFSEAPSGWNGEPLIVQFRATGLDANHIATDHANLSGLAKNFFASDGFSGFGEFGGDGLTENIGVDCRFGVPTHSAISGIDYANISIAADDPSNCSDLRNCCVYTIDADYVDPCAITIQCVLDPLLQYLDNTQLNFNFYLRQQMETNMPSDTGLIVTAIMEHGDPNDRDIFSLDTAQIDRDDCDGTTDKFVVNNDDPWSDISGVNNGQDILDHDDYLWNVDTIGTVDVVDAFAACEIFYENIAGSLSLADIAAGGSIAKNTLLDGSGKICNSRSHTDCEGDGTITFDFTLDMYDPDGVGGDDLPFAQAGVSHICSGSGSEGPNVDGCNGVDTTCMPYLINGAGAAPAGCMLLCMDVSELGDGTLVDPSPIAVLEDAASADCAGNNGTIDGDTGFCMPNQQVVCADAFESDLVMFNEPKTYAEAGVFSHPCNHPWIEGCGPGDPSDSSCIPYYTNATGACENLCIDVSVGAPLMANQALTDPACTDTGGIVIADFDDMCLPTQLEECLPTGGDFYALDDTYTVIDGGVGAEKSTADYVDHIFETTADLGEPVDPPYGPFTLQDLYTQCADVGMRAEMATVQFYGTLNQASADCVAVAERFIVDPTALPENRVLNGHFSVELADIGVNEYLRVFHWDPATNASHPQAAFGTYEYSEKLLFWDNTLGLLDSWFEAPLLADAVSLGAGAGNRYLYSRNQANHVVAQMEVGWIDPVVMLSQLRGDKLDNDYLIIFELEQDTSAVDCSTDDGFGFYLDVIGIEWDAEQECTQRDEYIISDAYIGGGVAPVVLPIEEQATASMATMFSHGSDAQNNGAADLVWNVDKTVYQYQIDCVNAHGLGTRLAAIPYYRNTAWINTDDNIDDVCRNVADRFVDTTVVPMGPEGVSQLLTPYPVSVEFEDRGFATQGLVVRILDGSDTPVFEDITGEYLVGDATKIPARGLTFNTATQWFGVINSGVKAVTNHAAGTMNGHPMSVYTTGGTDYNPAVIDGYVKVSTEIELRRIREFDLHAPEPENVYLLILNLRQPVDGSGVSYGSECLFQQVFVIDGTCACELDDSC